MTSLAEGIKKRGFWGRWAAAWRLTSVRLTAIFLGVFLLFSILFVSITLVGVGAILHREAVNIIDEETIDLSNVYRRGGVTALARVIEVRSRAPGANLYLLVRNDGVAVAGNIKRIPSKIFNTRGSITQTFEYEPLDGVSRRKSKRRFPWRSKERQDRRDLTESFEERRAIARIVSLPRGFTVLVGRDFVQPERFKSIVGVAVTFIVLFLAITAILSWLLLGRRALNRIEAVSSTSKRIIDGDLTQRLPASASGDEFDRLASALNELLDRVEKLDGGIKEMSDSVAHDLKTPLTRLRNRAEMALSQDKSVDQLREALSDVLDQSDQTIRIFNALLMISRVEAGAQAGMLEPVDAAQIMRDIAELYEAAAEDDDVLLRLEMPENLDVAMVEGNRELLGLAISNLVENALKYARVTASAEHDEFVTNMTSISLVMNEQDGHFELVVQDNGPGIAEEDLARVKQRFVRLDKSRSKQGSGLGLALVDAVAKRHKGDLVLEQNNPGLRAIIRLPRLNQS